MADRVELVAVDRRKPKSRAAVITAETQLHARDVAAHQLNIKPSFVRVVVVCEGESVAQATQRLRELVAAEIKQEQAKEKSTR